VTAVAALLADYAVGARVDDPATQHAAGRAFVDTLASAMAGREETSTRVAHAWAATATGGPGAPIAREWTTGATLLASEAAFANGVAAHALDLDDVSMGMWGHPSTLLVPVTLAVSETMPDTTVADLLAAYAVGLHCDLAVAAGFDLVDHYARGWHASVTVGMLGAVVAASRLLGLDADRTRHAVGLAVSMASGSRQNFGTTTKALHIGLAASNAVRAAQLAAAGADSSPEAVDGPLGFYALYGGATGAPEAVVAALATPEARSIASLNAKRYPCCYQTHRAIDAALDLCGRLGPIAEHDVAEVVVHVNPGSDNSLIHPFATTSTQARFCMRYVVAAGLLRGRVDFDSFTEAAVGAADVQALMRKVRLEHDETPPYDPVSYSLDYAAVLVRRTSGASDNVTCPVPRGSAERPMTDEELVAKAGACFDHAGVRGDARDLAVVLDATAAPATSVVDVLRALDEARPVTSPTTRTAT
jgi:2-methylcitrate dehydratase PrpD